MIDIKIADGAGNGKKVQVAESDRGYGNGIKVYSFDGVYYDLRAVNYSNDVNGSNMAVNAGYSGTPDGVHDGGDTSLWTASALSGTWDFASATQAFDGSASIDGSSANNNHEAQFERASTVDLTGYVAFSGQIYITSWPTSGSAKDVTIRIRLAGVDVSDELNLSDYIDTTNFNDWQSINIPIEDFNLSTDDIDQVVIKNVDVGGGAAPNYFLDVLQFEETSGGLVYKIQPGYEDIWEVLNVSFSMADALEGTVSNGTMPGLSYNKLLNVNQLSNGIQFQRIIDGETLFNAVYVDLFDLISGASDTNVWSGSDGTNTMIKITRKFGHPIRLNGRSSDQLRFIISDDLSGLLKFKCTSSIRIVEEEVGVSAIKGNSRG